MHNNGLNTRNGYIPFPSYIPVTTFGKKYPLDALIRPYLPRLSKAVMVSYYYAKQMDSQYVSPVPMMIDSGGFASLFSNARVQKDGKLGAIVVETEDGVDRIHPRELLDFQEQTADIAFTLDFPVPPNISEDEANERMNLTVNNALWAIDNLRRRDMHLYAVIQAWDKASAKQCAERYKDKGFAGVAIGGLVPRSRNMGLVTEIVKMVRDVITDKPVHVFGLGKPDTVKALFDMGVSTVDSSSYVKMAADGRLWSDTNYKNEDPTPTERMQLALINLATATAHTLPFSVSEKLFEHGES